MIKIIIKYTLIAFVITVIWTLIEHVLGYNTTRHDIGQYTRVITTFLYWGLVVAAIIEVKNKSGNKINFKTALNTGLGVAFGYSFLVTLWFALYAEVINTQYQPTLLAFERNKLLAAGASAEKISAKLKEVELTSGGSVMSYLLLFVYMALFGVGIAVVTSLFVQRWKAGKANK
jgi:hypothetical protein